MTLEELRESNRCSGPPACGTAERAGPRRADDRPSEGATSLPVYEPAREKVIYANVRAANKGPLPDIELTHIYERIIDVMRALQRNELASERNAQAAGPRHMARKRPRQGRKMIVAMQEKATEEQIDSVIDAMVEAGVNVTAPPAQTPDHFGRRGPTAV